ncbi:thioredoxin domain-containing protein [Patescibacteria group bacterium]
MKDKLTPVIVILIVIAAFLAGSLWMKSKYSGEKPAEGNKQQASGQPAAQAAPEFKAVTTDNPEVKFFVMSFCPYGNQAEYGLKPVTELLGDQVVWEPVYIVADAKASCELGCANRVYDEARCQQLVDSGRVPDMDACKGYFPYSDKETCIAENCVSLEAGKFDSLHGEQELNQDVREICAWNMGDEAKWWDFVDRVNKSCTYENADTCWEEHATAAGLDAAAISQCEQQQASNLLSGQLDIVTKFKVQGSPTIYINGVLYQGGRTPEDYKTAICASFKNPPEECNTVLSAGDQQAPAPGSCN